MDAREGGLDAFEELVRMHARRVYGIAYQISGNSDDAHDIAQEAFVKLHSGIKKYDPQFLFSTWLYRLAANISIDYLRRNARHTNVSLNDDQAHKHAEMTLRPDVEYEQSEMKGAISRISAELPDMQRKVFVLKDLQGFGCEEIARILECRASTVRVHLARARLKIREKLAEIYPEMVNTRKL